MTSPTIHSKIGEIPVYTIYNIKNDYETTLHINISGSQHIFKINAWSKQKFAHFAEIFLYYTQRDPEIFGDYEQDQEGFTRFILNPEHKKNIIVQACTDIMNCLEFLIKAKNDTLLDYATWYMQFSQNDTYDKFIMLETCRCISENRFITPGVRFDIVKFVEL